MSDVDAASTEARATKPRRRAPWGLAAVVVVATLVVGLLAGWAVREAFAPPATSADKPAFATVEVVEGEVGSSTRINAVATWSSRPVALNGGTGVVTSIDVEPGAPVVTGDVLYSLSLRPTVVAEGAIPAYGPMQPGDEGDQVSQLQRFLSELGYFGGNPDGEYGSGTEKAVRAWQRAAGFPVDGIVQEQDIVWVASLPTRVVLDSESFVVGQRLTSGEGEIFALNESPDFRIPLTQTQSQLAPEGTSVVVSAPDGSEWAAQVSAQVPDPENSDTINATLSAADDAVPICGDSCSQIEAVGQTLLNSQIVTVPKLTGLVVPAAAIRTDASGETSVIGPDGKQHPVTVVQTARGMSLVEGVKAGLSVRIPAGSE